MPAETLIIAASPASPLVWALLALLIAGELGLLAWALLDLARRPKEAVTGGTKILWLALCLLAQIVGPVLYLTLGRVRPAAMSAERGAPGGDQAAGEAGAVGAAAGAEGFAGEGRAAEGFAGNGRAAAAVAAMYPEPGGAASAPAVELVAVAKRFGNAAALDGLTLTVPEGSVFGFLGPNGAGKTTTLRILAGLAHADAGAVRVLGRHVGAPGADVRARIGYLPDVPAFYKWMTAAEYLRFAGSLFGLRGPALEARVEALLELAGLAGVETRVGGYSRGMRQRLGVAQALVNAPRLLLLDEPTSALDPLGRREVLDMVAALRGRTTVFFSTHILADVERVCDTAAIIDKGRVVTQASVAELRRRRGGLHRLLVEVDDPWRLEAELQSLPWLRGFDLAPDGGLRLSVDDLEAAQRAIPALVSSLGLALRRLQSDEPSLEDVFVGLLEAEQA
ncbi:MAG: ABC transporter ATP-binding protein [Thermoleophilia bacterium]